MKIFLFLLSFMFAISSCENEQTGQVESRILTIRPEIKNIIKSYIDSNQLYSLNYKVVKLQLDSVSKDTSSYVLKTIISKSMLKYYPSNFFYIDSTLVIICDGARDLYTDAFPSKNEINNLLWKNIDTTEDMKIYDPIVWKIYITKDTIFKRKGCDEESPIPVLPTIKFNPPKI
jgi:hypothetical protein